MLKKQQDTFDTLTTEINEYKIFYSLNGIIYIPECVKITQINVLKLKDTTCVSDIPVSFMLNNKTFIGYLSPNKIIRQTMSSKTLCSNTLVRYLPLTKQILVWHNGKSILMKPEHLVPLDELNSFIKEFNFPHSQKVLDELIKFEWSAIEPNNFKELILSKNNFIKGYEQHFAVELNEKFGKIFNKIKAPFSNYKKYSIIIFIIILFIILFCLIGVFGPRCYVGLFKCLNFIKRKPTVQNIPVSYNATVEPSATIQFDPTAGPSNELELDSAAHLLSILNRSNVSE